ncbi:MAG: dethiobiotin synthase [Mariprofundaceae bacterium]|nr:dethiobiotin synthase [Mariprofundaceae bacterium]
MGISVFITATDTNAGKTFVTASLARVLAATKLKTCALKPVCCGRNPGQMNPDIKALLRAQEMPDTQTGAVNLYDFTAAAAPDQAAAEQGMHIEPEKLVQWCAARMLEHDITLIEGVGGLMVPLAENFMVSDWLAAMPDCIVVLVVRAKIGGINHALLTLKHLRHMQRDPAWIIINDVDHGGSKLLRHHAEAMAPRLKSGTRLLNLPHQQDMAHTVASSQFQALIADITQLARREKR